jgi:uncharacterized RDD family membrane protein YckC
MFCSKCGNNLTPGTAFCQICGAAAPAAAVPFAAAPALVAGPTSPHWLPAPTRTYAGFWLRFVAHLIDGAILGVVGCVLFIPLFFLTGFGVALHGINPERPPDPAMVAALVSSVGTLVVVSILLSWLYSAYFESSEWQGTIGKKVINLIVTDLEGNRVSFGRATGRFFAKMVSGLIPFGIGYIMAGFTERKQALHDMIASCLVLRS